MNIEQLRHPKEKLYKSLCIVFGAFIWISIILGTLLSILLSLSPPVVLILWILLVVLILWMTGKFFQVRMFGNSVHVNERQYSEINQIVNELSEQLQLKQKPDTFIISSQGEINAFAVKFLNGKYILLFSDLVDLLWENNKNKNQLRFVIAHELAHHAAGHMSFKINLLMRPAMFIPFLGAAYSRSCELTCDRIAAELVQDQKSSVNALISLSLGSTELIHLTDKDAFIMQEIQVPGVFGFLQEIVSSHPRMTKRVIAIENYQSKTLINYQQVDVV